MITALRRPLERVPLGKLAFELFLVFVAVSAALFANAWWQERQVAGRGQAAIAAFAAEMRRNQAQITERIDHHREVAANAKELLRELAAGATLPADVDQLRNRLTAGKGMRTPLLSRAAWDSALIAGAAAEIPFATVLQVAEVYEVQRRLDGVLGGLIANFTSPTYFEAGHMSATVTAFAVTFSMIVELETDQLAGYERCLATLAGG